MARPLLPLYAVTMTISIAEDLSRPSQNHRKFKVDFNGTPVATTALPTSPPSSVVRKWLRTTFHLRRRHLRRLVVGLGVQWRPNLYPGEDSPAATIQICVGLRCLIFQLIHSETVPRLLRRFLVNPNNTFVGMWNHSDADKLLNSTHELDMLREPPDLRLYAVSKHAGRSRVKGDHSGGVSGIPRLWNSTGGLVGANGTTKN